MRFAVAPSGSLAPDIAAEARRSMKRTPKYNDGPLGRLELLDDLLPPPDRLVLREDGIKVTLSLSKKSVAFFKERAARSKVPYQRMIRSLLDAYADRHVARDSTTRAMKRRGERAVRERGPAHRR
jgi:hypothetical protein